MDGRVDLARIGRMLAELEADVVVLNEVRCRGRAGRRGDQVAALGGMLGMRCEPVWCPAIGVGFGRFALYRFGNTLITAGDVLAQRVVRLGRRGGLEPRSALVAEVAVRGARWWVCGTHLDVLRSARRAQATALADTLAALPGPAVLAGDLNADLAAEELAPIAAWAADHAGALRTFPSDQPREQRDHVVAGPGCAIIRARTVDVPYSDHLPVVAVVSRT